MPTFAFLYAPGYLAVPIHRDIECSPTTITYVIICSFGGILKARVLSMQDRSTSELLRTL